MTDFTPERLAELKARAEAATQGEWRRVAQGGSSTVLTAIKPARNDTRIPNYGYRDDGEHCLAYPFIGDGNVVGDVRLDFVCFSHEDAAHIASTSPANLLALIAALEAAWARIEDLEAGPKACAGASEGFDAGGCVFGYMEALSTRLQAELAEAREIVSETIGPLEYAYRGVASVTADKVVKLLRRAVAFTTILAPNTSANTAESRATE